MACFGDEDIFDILETNDQALPEADVTEEADIIKAAAELKELLKRTSSDVNQKDSVVPRKKVKKTLRNAELRLTEELPQIKVHTIETVDACTHEVAIPPHENYTPLEAPKHEPAKTYPFVLDPFQKEAILCIDNNQSVLVSAHTSAGKTVVAEYSIAMCLANKQRVIYTTPIKALSNQKFRDFSEEFTDVGLMTGDVTINPNASCLIMTTEILRSMLYRGSEVTREVGWVIFDEIHYMRDKERGYVWEETIILLSPTVHFVFLSATIPNASQFAQWIVYLHHQPCHVVYTDYRPTPLQHYIYPAGGEGMYLVVDEKGVFREDNFNTAMSILQSAPEQQNQAFGSVSGGGSSSSMQKKKPTSGNSECLKLVKTVMERNMAPVIIFSFSKKECEAFALQISKLDFNLPQEKQLVDEVFTNATAVLSDEDKQLPQVVSVLPLLRRGIGIHHGGLLPIIKETVEILFGEGLIKALFATETFAMGLNMPARTVLFTSTRKFDGQDFRWLTSGEYIQMSGRAGRRGKDDKGIVIMMVDEKLDSAIAKNLVQGKADPMNSAFHLTYNMVLNLLRVEQINPEYILERSFFQFQNFLNIPSICEKVEKAEKANEDIEVPDHELVEGYYKMKQNIDNLLLERHTFITRPAHILPFLQPGRLVKIKNGADDFGWAVVLKYDKKDNKKDPTAAPTITVDVIMTVSKVTADKKITSLLAPALAGERSVAVVVPVLLRLVQELSAVRLKLPADLSSPDHRTVVMKMAQEAIKRVPEDQFLLDPVTNMKIKDETFMTIVSKLKKLQKRLAEHALNVDPRKDKLLALFEQKMQAQANLKVAEAELRAAKSVLQLEELKCRKRVLRRLGYATAQDVIEKKGRVACELSAADELLITEMLFNGLFNDLTAAQTCSLLSTFVCDEKSSEMPKLGDELSGPLRQMQEMARRIAKVVQECKLDIVEEEYVEKFKPFLMDVVYDWCNGSSFLEICKKTDIFEGSIIRAMRRLEELLRQMIQAAKAIGIDLENKFAEGVKLLKRDIVFAASLYL
ncbi:exosome RNA helicase MTR4 [Hyalella azteca]|uniref:Exosome RNA helicase MTR4 n=1 Tax=Hyalella azteca TaxID=294128 RepID=A0A8B7PA94_HYAAZ|nr:exosome RNA helicase MTR4 [Hyalella azteca]